MFIIKFIFTSVKRHLVLVMGHLNLSIVSNEHENGALFESVIGAVRRSEHANAHRLQDELPRNAFAELFSCLSESELSHLTSRMVKRSYPKNALIIYGPMAAKGEHGAQVRNALTNLALVADCYERLAYVGLDANSQGCRDMGVLPDALPGHFGLDDAASVQKIMTTMFIRLSKLRLRIPTFF